ncbi:MAG TPA: stage II sporulation protein M [Candidatus Binatia bacterium]|jgi:stage II sporulation protein M
MESGANGSILRQQYEYLRCLGKYFCASLIFLAGGIVAGIVAIFSFPALSDHLQREIGGFVHFFRALPKLNLVAAIFFNNALKTLLVILLGRFFGLVPVVFLLANGAAIAIAVHSSSQLRGLALSLLVLVPHGLLELPAVLLGTSVGLMIGAETVKRVLGKGDHTNAGQLSAALKFFLTVIVPLLIVAASIEVFVTPVVAGL